MVKIAFLVEINFAVDYYTNNCDIDCTTSKVVDTFIEHNVLSPIEDQIKAKYPHFQNVNLNGDIVYEKHKKTHLIINRYIIVCKDIEM